MYPIEVVKNAMIYIGNHSNEELNCKVVAEKFSYSEFHFHRLFKYITNMSITDYIRDRRLIAAADKLLKETDTILDICLSSGFENQQTFDRVFKQKYGLSPKDFRALNPSVEKITPETIISNFYYRIMQEGNAVLKPYIIEKGVLKFIGRSAKMGGSKPTGEDIGMLYDDMAKIFQHAPNQVDEKFYGITINFANSTENSRREYWLCKEVKNLWHENKTGDWERLCDDMESLILPASRWLYVPVRYDDPFVKNLAPEEFRNDNGYLTPCVYDWGKLWLAENGYKPQDYPFEMEIYGLHDGYEGIEGGANITLAIPMI